MIQVAIAADDLTGANAAGALLAAKGLRAATCLGLENWSEAFLASVDALSVSTDSRLIPADQAKQRVFDTVAAFARLKPRFVAKRIDTTLRGNLGAEIEGALAALGPEALAVVVPAFPATGRHAVGGYVLVDGVALEQTAVARDPATPVRHSRYVPVIAEQTALPIARVDLETVLSGPGATREAIRDQYDRGVRIVALDAVSDADVVCVAQALRGAPFPLLAVDPGPFTAALAEALGAGGRPARDPAVLCVIGSASELTCRQIEHLRSAHPSVLVRVDCRLLAGPDPERQAEIDRAVRLLSRAARDYSILGVCTVERPDHACALDQLADSLGVAVHEVSRRINAGLAAVAAQVLDRPEMRVGGLYTSGGEVTLAVTRRLKAAGFSVRRQVLPLAVFGRLLQGDHADLPIVTKGGLVGDNAALSVCVEFLKHQLAASTPARG